MEIIAQGLRRSGTTILYDIISEDQRFTTFYEPLAKEKQSIGGGSGIQQFDVMAGLREARNKFSISSRIENIEFNFGAPNNYKLEVGENHLPETIRKYIRFLLNSGENTLLKFTRGTFFVEQLHELSPNALFIHLEKNPALWVMSHMFGKDYSKNIWKDADQFFQMNTGFNFWSQEAIANYYIEKTKPAFNEKPAFFKLLYVWKEFNETIKKEGTKYFKSNFLTINNSELFGNYESILNRIYSFGDLSVPNLTLHWAKKNLRPPRGIVHASDERWREAFEELNIDLNYLQ